jgi:hypothetical protein
MKLPFQLAVSTLFAVLPLFVIAPVAGANQISNGDFTAASWPGGGAGGVDRVA